jgi:PAS domain S-box-containing protein
MNDAIVDPDKIGLQIQSSTVADMLIRSPFGKRGTLEDKPLSDPSPDFDVEDYRRFFEADADQPFGDITGDAGDGMLDAPISGFLDNVPDADGDGPAGIVHPPLLPGFGDETDAFRGEKPALRIVENPGRRHSDKVVSIEAHRSKARDGLSLSEQAAFTEIARHLDPFGKRLSPDAQTSKDRSGTEQAKTESAEETRIGKDETQVSAGQPFTPDMMKDMAALIPSRSNSSEFLTAEFVDALPLAILVHTGETLIHANPEFFRLTGYQSLAQLKDYGGLDALLEQDQTRILADDAPTMLMARADGALEPVNARLQSVRWEDSHALLLALAPKRAENERVQAAKDALPPPDPKSDDTIKALEIEVEELHSILETATDGVVIVGHDGDIRSLNKSASALFNFDPDDVVGKSFAMLFAHESQKAVMDYLAGLTGHGVASVLNDGREVIGRESSGGFIPIFMTMGRLSSSNGYCAVIRDITQWKRTEEELRTAKRAAETANAHKSEFLARVSHEIRTPLNAIIGFSDMMATQRLGPIGHPRYVEYSDDIGRSGRHVLDIVNDLLDISKIEAGEMDLEFTAVELNDTVSEAVSLVQPQVNSQRVIIRTSLSQSVPNIVADQRSIKQIAINILANAIRYTPAGGQIVVSTAYEANGSVVLRIRDTGIGMDRAELEQALKPFRQVTTGNRKKGDGTGLGLPLTKAMVDANRAQFAISSVPNEGTLVEITFPSPRVLAN